MVSPKVFPDFISKNMIGTSNSYPTKQIILLVVSYTIILLESCDSYQIGKALLALYIANSSHCFFKPSRERRINSQFQLIHMGNPSAL